MLSITMMITVNIINQDSNKTVYADDVPATDSKTINITYTVYPTVSFDKNGASSADIADQVTNESYKVAKPADPSKQGSTFSGWSYNDGTTEKIWDFEEDKVPVDKNITLKAKWTDTPTPEPTPTPKPTPKPVTPSYVAPKTGIEGMGTPILSPNYQDGPEVDDYWLVSDTSIALTHKNNEKTFTVKTIVWPIAVTKITGNVNDEGNFILSKQDSNETVEYTVKVGETSSKNEDKFAITNTNKELTITVDAQSINPGIYTSVLTLEADPVEKGDLITIDGSQYRVLKNTSGTEFLVIAMKTAASMVYGSNNTYANSDIDNYLNTTWYGALSDAMKNAIVPKIIKQSTYNMLKPSDDTNYTSVSNEDMYWLVTRTTEVEVGERKVYALDVDDVLEYLPVHFTWEEFKTMFLTDTTKTPAIKLRSANGNLATGTFDANCNLGRLGLPKVETKGSVRPAFVIDLSQIDFE